LHICDFLYRQLLFNYNKNYALVVAIFKKIYQPNKLILMPLFFHCDLFVNPSVQIYDYVFSHANILAFI